MFRPVLNGRSIIQMIDPARDFRGMGRQVTRTCRHMRVMFSVENDASIQHRSIRFFETINFNYDFAFHDTALILLPSLDSFSIRFDYLSSLDYFVSMETLFARFEIESFCSGTREARLPLSFFLFSPFSPSFFFSFLIRITSVRRRLLHCRSNDRRERCFCYRLPGSVAVGN